jgi:23S rRNA pseudouridine1911/1915/1917 synthase
MRLDLALIAQHPELSRRKAREVIEKGQVTLRGDTVQEPGRLVRPGEAVAWNPNRPARPRARIRLPLLYRDESMVVIDKPAGLLAVPSAPDAAGEDTAEARVHEFAAHLNPRHPYVGVVHRLDRDTSGALAFALTPTARGALRALFREHRMERRYAALVEGIPPADEGVVELPISESYAGKRRVARPGEPSLPARTRWRVVQRFAGGALLEVELDTGRQHQIRVHLSHVGLPIVGDPVYRKETRRRLLEAPRQMLHARVLGFVHPLTGVAVRCESPLPEDFKTALRQLRQQKGGATYRLPGGRHEQRPPDSRKTTTRGSPRSRSPR